MATDDTVTQQHTTGQQWKDVDLMLSELGQLTPEQAGQFLESLDAEQAWLLLVCGVLRGVVWFGNLLIHAALDSGRPEVAHEIKHDFEEWEKTGVGALLDELLKARDEFRQLWPRLQSILRDIESHGLKAIDLYWPIISETLNSMRERGYICPGVSNEDVVGDLLQGDSIIGRQLPPGHSLWHLLGVENEGEWNKLTPAQQQVMLCLPMERKQPFSGIVTRLLHRWAGDSSVSSVSQEGVVHGDELLVLAATMRSRQNLPQRKLRQRKRWARVTRPDTMVAESEKPHIYLNDADRLSQFCELGGVDMSDLTESDRSRILDILRALDAGYDFASKQGVSMSAYYSDKAESEEKPRERLFKKLREARNRAK